jgi:hypothetical protein
MNNDKLFAFGIIPKLEMFSETAHLNEMFKMYLEGNRCD